MAINSTKISTLIKDQILNYKSKIDSSEVGKVLSVGDGVSLVSGLDNVKLGELVNFGNDIFGMVLNLEEYFVGVVILGDEKNIFEGQKVKRTKKVIQIPVGDYLLGRVINALGEPIDGKGEIISHKSREIFRVAPGVMTREEVNQPLETGIIAIDALVPIGKGQRELIIGDRQTGKTSIAIDTIINQKGKNVNCVYVAIGQKNSSVSQIVKTLEENDALSYTTILVAGASESAPLQYIAPYSGVTIAEEWMESGKDVLIVYDDLSKHAIAYRTLSLILRRPPGREAYPGDVFYLHSQLLERAARVNKNYGGGTITALPIIETQSNDISAYIPTNVISITDGQIFTRDNLFNSGQRPAIDVGFSVSRVGSNAQTKAMKKASAELKLTLSRFNELESFSQFGSDLDEATKEILTNGRKIYDILKQKQFNSVDQELQTVILYAIRKKYIKYVPEENIKEFKLELINFLKKDEKGKNIIHKLKLDKDLTDEIKEEIDNILFVFLEGFLLSYGIKLKKENI
ncbi:MAG: F0F1 ATP synthase subunit alpha [Metamycoplasmataceae bacterium]